MGAFAMHWDFVLLAKTLKFFFFTDDHVVSAHQPVAEQADVPLPLKTNPHRK
jgi:hypothetical protein